MTCITNIYKKEYSEIADIQSKKCILQFSKDDFG